MPKIFSFAATAICAVLFCSTVYSATPKLEAAFETETVRFAFLAPDTLNPANAAVYNGASDAFAELEARFGKKFEIKYVSARGQASVQIKQLGGLYVDNFSGAIVSPVFGNCDVLAKKAGEMKARGFFCALVGSGDAGDSFIASVSTDMSERIDAVKKEMLRLSKNTKPSLLCYLWSQSPAQTLDIGQSSALDALLYPTLDFDGFRSITDGFKILKIESLEYYSVYAAANAIEIKRLDNFAEIFFSPQLLANLSPVARDTDRVFSLCLGALPQLDYYLADGMLDSCIYDDYYGWGYFAARALAEKVCSGNDPETKDRRLKPLVATPYDVEKFRRDWKLWLK